MIENINSLLIAVVLALAHVTLVFCLVHKIIPNRFSPIVTHIFSGICILILLAGLALSQFNFDVWLSFCVFAFFSAFFLFLFSAVYKSLSLRFLLLTRARSSRLSFTEIDALITDLSFAERIELLCSMGFVNKAEEGYEISQQGQRVARRIERVRQLLGITTKGLYQE